MATDPPSLSLICNVLNSHEAVRRQLLYFERWLPRSCELVLVDDGSQPSLRQVCEIVRPTFPLTIVPTRDSRPWTSPRARNIGARVAFGQLLLLFDIDHILTPQLVEDALLLSDDRVHWNRQPGVLDDSGQLQTDPPILYDYGWDGAPVGVAPNSFVIRRDIFQRMGGYDEQFCGRYGGDDIDFNERYDALVRAGHARPAVVRGTGFVFPNPNEDRMGLFHRLQRS